MLAVEKVSQCPGWPVKIREMTSKTDELSDTV